MTAIGFLILCYLAYLLYKSRKELLNLIFRRETPRRGSSSTRRRDQGGNNAKSNEFIDKSEAEYVEFEDITDTNNN
ncbi:MAG: hypothetical protein ILA34_01810 [Bacteroidaceae bacterium]|nr:hypothetical protein [Bacteroidaceae bacterium]